MTLVVSADDVRGLERLNRERDIGDSAVWTLSSCKSGCGVDKLRDNDTNTYWQSEGEQPHVITIEFMRKTAVSSIAMFVDYTQDESYTPKQLSIRVGNHGHDIREITTVEIEEGTCGWVVVPLTAPDLSVLKVFTLEVGILANHQNGRDTHLRLLRIHTAKLPPVAKHLREAMYFSGMVR